MAACESAVLVLALLSIEDSYVEEIERPKSDVPDTVQFWLGPDSQWRIKTFAIDHDIHIYRLDDGAVKNPLSSERAEANIRKSYGDVIESIRVIRFECPTDSEASARTLVKEGLSGSLEVATAGFAFYNPDAARYHTQSKPKR
jgi:hypothetical protein